MPIPFLSFRKSTLEPLAVSMCGVRMGERVLQVGMDDAALFGALAAKVGLSGQAAASVADERAAASVRAASERAGALVDVRSGRLEALPFDDGAFDVAIVHGMRGLLSSRDEPARLAMLREIHRVLRQGGRIVVVEPGPGGGLGGMLKGRASTRTDPSSLAGAGFKASRVLAEREGFTFTEGLKT